jgi:hypothetical protein
MNNRWGIISGPRTGSTWLEHSIGDALLEHDSSTVQLGEFIHPHIGFNNTINILPGNKLECIKEQRNSFNSKQELIQYGRRIINTGNITQSVTCRIFTQIDHYSYYQYRDLFTVMHNRGFKLINLNRNLFDRTLSLYFALETGIWHRVNVENQISLVRHSEMPQDKNIKPIEIDINKFISNYLYLKIDTEIRRHLFKDLPGISINYENMQEEIKQHDIPFVFNKVFIRTHEENYEKFILNYDEVLKSVQNL